MKNLKNTYSLHILFMTDATYYDRRNVCTTMVAKKAMTSFFAKYPKYTSNDYFVKYMKVSDDIQSRMFSETTNDLFLAYNCVRGNLYVPMRLYKYFYQAIQHVSEQMWMAAKKGSFYILISSI